MSKEYYLKHREEILARAKQYRIENKEKVRGNKRKSYHKNRTRILEQQRHYNKQNKEQNRIRSKEYQINNKEKLKKQKRKSYLKNKEKIIAKCKQYRLDNIEKIRIRTKKYRVNNKEQKRESDRKYRLKNLNTLRIKKKLYYHKVKNTEPYKEKQRINNKLYNQTSKRKKWNRLYARRNYKRAKERQARYWANNPDSLERRDIWVKTYNKTYKKKHRLKILLQLKTRRENDPNFKMRSTLRSRIWTVLKRKNTPRLASTLTLLGVDSVETVINHIENQFESWMNWSNHGEWHLDHIKPCASFDLNSFRGQRACFNYKNLRPLEAFENMSKGSKRLDLNNKP
jgi:hypothetical protein